MPDTDLEADRVWFEANRSQLLRRYAGQHVAIVDGSIVDHDADFDRLARRTYAAYGARSIYMPRVSPTNRVVHARTPRMSIVRRGVMPTVVAAVVALAGAGTGAAREGRDPARIAGTWNYVTRSNCGSVEGVGRVTFRWDAQQGAYRETGQVYWADSGSTIRWWGPKRWDAQTRRLEGRTENSLGDTVEGHWAVEGPGPDRLVVRWTQTNGCVGTGIATRRARARR